MDAHMTVLSAPHDETSSRSDSPLAQSATKTVSASSSSSISTPSVGISPSRGLKRTRDNDITAQQLSATFPTPAGDQPPSKRAYASPSTATSSPQGGSPSVPVGGTLRISNELLRNDNHHLQQQLAKVQSEKAALDSELAQQKQRVRNLEEDLTRIYRRQKREAESQQTAHSKAMNSLREELARITQQLEDRPVIDPRVAMLTPETTQEMDAFVAMCSQWQQKLTALSAKLASQVTRVEQADVQAVMDGMVHKVDAAYRLSQVQEAEKVVELQRVMLREKEQDLKALAQRLQAEREDTETFERTERLVLEQRVVEVEKDLENAGDKERMLLRQTMALQAELSNVRSGNHVVPHNEWLKRVEEEAQTKDQLETLTVRCEAQNVQLTLLREELTSLQAENDELAADLTARKQAAAGDDDTASIVTMQLEDRITELKEQLAEVKMKARETEDELRNNLTAKMQEEAETLRNRIEVLTLNVEAKAKVIDNLSVEKTELLARLAQQAQAMDVMQADAALLGQQMEAKTHQIETLRYEISELELNLETKLKQAIDNASSEKLELQRQMTTKTCDWVELNRELKEAKRLLEAKAVEVRTLQNDKGALESQNAKLHRLEELWRNVQPEITALEAKNKELLDQQQQQTNQAVRLQDQLAFVANEKQLLQVEAATLRSQVEAAGAKPANQSVPLQNEDGSLSPELQARIAKLLVEKRAVETFLQQYFDVAEAKCHSLSTRVAHLEQKHAMQRQYAQDSCQLLRMCTQIDACDSTVRASLLDVMTTLESIS